MLGFSVAIFRVTIVRSQHDMADFIWFLVGVGVDNASLL